MKNQTSIFDHASPEEKFVQLASYMSRTKDFKLQRESKRAGRRIRRDLRKLIKLANELRKESLKIEKS